MKPSELTTDVVRAELVSIMDRYPDNTGAFEIVKQYDDGEEFVDPTCVYFTDEAGSPISSNTHALDSEVVFAAPVCIVGMWIEEFHPNFKENEVIRSVLIRNATIRSLAYDNEKPWDEGVQRLLTVAQDTQDRGNTTWGIIDLDADLF